MPSMKVIVYIELGVACGARHLKEMRDAAERFADKADEITVAVDPEDNKVAIAEFTMPKARQADVVDRIMRRFAQDMPDYETQSICFPRSAAEDRKAQKASERVKRKRTEARSIKAQNPMEFYK